MILSLHAQAKLFALTILIGGSMGLLYDGLRILRRTVPHSRFWIQLEDAVFWLLSVFAVFLLLLRANAGEVRFFAIFGLFGGMGLYFLALSPFVLAFSNTVLRIVGFLLRLLGQILFTPFYLLYLPFRRPLSFVGGFCAKQRKKCLQSLRVYVKIKKNHLHRDCKLLRQKRKQSDKPSKNDKGSRAA